jgi:probable HAF family extracellular repeat protein
MKTELGFHMTVARHRTLILFVLFAFLAGASTAAAQSYSVEPLGTLGGPASAAVGINDAGQVVGNITDVAGAPLSPFFYSNGVMTAIPNSFGGSFSVAQGMNNLGQVTGTATFAGDTIQHAFVWSAGSVVDLGTLQGPNATFSYSVGYALNDFGIVVGESKNEAFIYQDGRMTGFSRRAARSAHSINDVGQIVGMLESNRAFLFDQKTMKDLGTLDGGQNSTSGATAINESGQVVGYSVTSDGGTTHAFLYENGVMRDLGTLRGGYSVALGINNLGAVVGESDGTAFLYQNGQMIDLNSLNPGPVILRNAVDINENGQIAGTGFFFDVGNRAFILSPLLP